MGERLLDKQEARGSIPRSSTLARASRSISKGGDPTSCYLAGVVPNQVKLGNPRLEQYSMGLTGIDLVGLSSGHAAGGTRQVRKP